MHLAEVVEDAHFVAVRNSTRRRVRRMEPEPELGVVKFTQGAGDHLVVGSADQREWKAFLSHGLVSERCRAQRLRGEMHFAIWGEWLHILELHRPTATKRICLDVALERRRRITWLAGQAESVGHFAHAGGGIQ